jgi:hypothetical protein
MVAAAQRFATWSVSDDRVVDLCPTWQVKVTGVGAPAAVTGTAVTAYGPGRGRAREATALGELDGF